MQNLDCNDTSLLYSVEFEDYDYRILRKSYDYNNFTIKIYKINKIFFFSLGGEMPDRTVTDAARAPAVCGALTH